ncbi:MAG: Asp-tRNA(Asn)/Glu-tRNA(Gln) amidotransferase subunit GatC [Candidatus Paceibacterota bacterium]|jgi:aspartyl-tRNA(Asn)/glutamyl-tRNA(Gln) amidotransferase subunit C
MGQAYIGFLFFVLFCDKIKLRKIMDNNMININEVNHLLELSRLEISDEEKNDLQKDLDNILKYIEKLSEVNTENIEPMTGGTFNINEYRKDNFENREFDRNKVLSSAPKKNNDFFEVPKVFG